MLALGIFSIAFVVRSIVGYIFYGSIDVGAFMSINAHTFNGTLVQHPFTIWCAFPIIPFYLWLAGLLAIKTPLPIAFCFKLIPIIFDSLIAVLVYDFVKRINHTQAAISGFLYALSPLALMITCIHGQWDALPILFLLLSLYVRDFYEDSFKKYFLFGALFAFSFLLKPIPLIFIPFFFVPWARLKQTLGVWWTYLWIIVCAKLAVLLGFFIFFKLNKAYSIDMFFSPALLVSCVLLLCMMVLAGTMCRPWRKFSQVFQHYLSYQMASIIGLAAMVALCCAFLALYGFNIIRVVDKVLRYCNQGIAVFGLPFGYPFDQGVLNILLKNRIWIMGIITFIAVLYYKRKINVYQGILASLMIIFSFSGMSPQYLVWAIPFFLITGMYRCAVVFNAVCTIFCIFYYMNPFSNPEVLYQSMLSFAPLQSFDWLLPSAFFANESLLPVVRVLGNYIIPAMCFFTAIMIMKTIQRPSARRVNLSISIRTIYLWLSMGLTVVIAMLMWVVDTTGFSQTFKDVITEKMLLYDTHIVDGYLSGRYEAFNVCNIINLFLLITIVWCIIAWRAGKREAS